jgi:hypothetical protein
MFMIPKSARLYRTTTVGGFSILWMILFLQAIWLRTLFTQLPSFDSKW